MPGLEGGLTVGLPDDLALQPFGMLVATAVLVGTFLAERRARQEGIHPQILGEMAGYLLIFGFVIGHVLDAVFYHWDEVVRRPVFLLEIWNGLSSFGGFFGAVVGGLVWCWRRGYPFIPFADPIAWALPFGWLFGRLGCFVAHDHPGHITDFPLAVADYQSPYDVPPYPARHDLGLYEVLWCLAVIPLFLWLGRTPRRRGFYLALLPLLYAPVRFGLDFLRATDHPNGDNRFYGLTPGHYAAVLLLALGIWTWLRVHRGPPIGVPLDARWPPETLEVLDDPGPGDPPAEQDRGSSREVGRTTLK